MMIMMKVQFDRSYRRGGNRSHRWRRGRWTRWFFRNRTHRWVLHSVSIKELGGGDRRTWRSEIEIVAKNRFREESEVEEWGWVSWWLSFVGQWWCGCVGGDLCGSFWLIWIFGCGCGWLFLVGRGGGSVCGVFIVVRWIILL